MALLDPASAVVFVDREGTSHIVVSTQIVRVTINDAGRVGVGLTNGFIHLPDDATLDAVCTAVYGVLAAQVTIPVKSPSQLAGAVSLNNVVPVEVGAT